MNPISAICYTFFRAKGNSYLWKRRWRNLTTTQQNLLRRNLPISVLTTFTETGYIDNWAAWSELTTDQYMLILTTFKNLLSDFWDNTSRVPHNFFENISFLQEKFNREVVNTHMAYPTLFIKIPSFHDFILFNRVLIYNYIKYFSVRSERLSEYSMHLNTYRERWNILSYVCSNCRYNQRQLLLNLYIRLNIEFGSFSNSSKHKIRIKVGSRPKDLTIF